MTSSKQKSKPNRTGKNVAAKDSQLAGFTIRIHPDKRYEIKEVALRRRVTVSGLVESWIDEGLARAAKNGGGK